MEALTTSGLALRRLLRDWKLMLSIFLGIVVATSLMAGAPLYLDALARQGVSSAIDSAVQRNTPVFLGVDVSLRFLSADSAEISQAEDAIGSAAQRHLALAALDMERYVRTAPYLMVLPPGEGRSGARPMAGYFQSLTNLERHVRFAEGRMAQAALLRGTQGPMLEAIVSTDLARAHGFQVGEVLVATPAREDPVRLSVRIVGIFQPLDPSEDYWQGRLEELLSPAAIDQSPITGDPNTPPMQPVALFVAHEPLAQALGQAYPGAMVSPSWFIFVDAQQLKRWSSDEIAARISGFEEELSKALPGLRVNSGIKQLVASFERGSFLSSVPLALLLTVLAVTVLYFLFMIVSYLVPSRETGVAMLRSRGAGTLRLLRLYLIEGSALTVVAGMIGLIGAIVAVAMAGRLPYFRHITGGDMLPLHVGWMPFAVAIGAALLCLAIFVVPGIVGARRGLADQRLKSSRPPSMPSLQRYYLDLGLLAIGGMLFWELRARGQLVSGGLFKDAEVNEALLVAPVLFLMAVALLFFRLFPMFVRFVSGESPALAHVVAVGSIIVLAPTIAFRDFMADDRTAWVLPVLILLALAAVYRLTSYAQGFWPRLMGLAAQGGLVALFFTQRPFVADDWLLVPMLGLALAAPLQLLFLLFRASAARLPVWVSVPLWHMARNPLQYSWLVLLLVLAAGVGVLATTVGGTLLRNSQERILYDVGGDIRVSGIPGFIARSNDNLRQTYAGVPGVTSVSVALRETGRTGAESRGAPFRVLAVEPDSFRAWYRQDFSQRPLPDVLQALRPAGELQRVMIPEGATHLNVWVKPAEFYPLMSLWMVLEDATGRYWTVTFGRMGRPEWHVVTAEVPSRLAHPLRLASIQVSEPGFGSVGTPGSVVFDDIFVTLPDGGAQVIEDFEDETGWTPVATSTIAADSLTYVTEDAHQGRSAFFEFGRDTNAGIRGLYQTPGGGPLPVVASSTFAAATAARAGDMVIVEVAGALLPLQVRGIVDYFPTMDPGGAGFILADLHALQPVLGGLGVSARMLPNEVFIGVAPGAHDSVLDAVTGIVRRSGRVSDTQSQLRAVLLDPLVTAGWRAAVLVTLAVIVFVGGLGYAIYLLSFADRSIGEMGSMRSLGLSRWQMAGALGLEHVAMVVIGLSLGTWAGFQMSRLMVTSVAVTETGARVLPPVVLTTSWGLMGVIYTMLAVVFVGALVFLGRGMSRLDLRVLSRLENA